MTDLELYANIRELLGDPPPDRLSQRKLQVYVISALEWFAGECKYLVKEDNCLTLVTGQVSYPLPPNVLSVIWLSYNNVKIPPSSTWTWDRDGLRWRAATNQGPPQGYAVQGREVLLNPAPDAGTVAANPVIRMRWFAGPSTAEAENQVGMSELDSQIIVWQAAALYCMSHRSEENDGRKADYENWVQAMLPQAKARAFHPIEDFDPQWRPKTARTGGAR